VTKKILAITGIRSDYDLMSSLYFRLHADREADLKLLVGGAHLSKSYGYTLEQIEQDGFVILQKVESLLDADSISGRLKSASIFLQGCIDVVAEWSPDVIIYAGDREEVMIGALLGTYLEIPTIHFYGGDHTSAWHVDNPVRHATSKLSSIHAVTLQEHRDRLIKMGESANRIHVIGNMALDNFVHAETLSRGELSTRTGLPEHLSNFALVIFHPDPSEREIAPEIVRSILKVLKKNGIKACIGYPNTDPASFGIIDVIERFGSDPDFFVYKNLARQEFISLYKNALFIIGNSSSGILEAASIPIPAINVGARQRSRACGNNVIFCDSDTLSIECAVKKAIAPDFIESIESMVNPYGAGSASEAAHSLVMGAESNSWRLKIEDPLNLSGGVE
jgi:UDP-N-acetylglucosamine 2-epimerase (non-hydrolysing)/GDP/UDP-N,N'-diacetylbacillosamine 2-epimerase (hydrolysing)